MSTGLVRLGVNMNFATAEALDDLTGRLGISHTEAIRRAVAAYRYLHEQQDKGKKILIRGRKWEQEVKFL